MKYDPFKNPANLLYSVGNQFKDCRSSPRFEMKNYSSKPFGIAGYIYGNLYCLSLEFLTHLTAIRFEFSRLSNFPMENNLLSHFGVKKTEHLTLMATLWDISLLYFTVPARNLK